MRHTVPTTGLFPTEGDGCAAERDWNGKAFETQYEDDSENRLW